MSVSTHLLDATWLECGKPPNSIGQPSKYHWAYLAWQNSKCHWEHLEWHIFKSIRHIYHGKSLDTMMNHCTYLDIFLTNMSTYKDKRVCHFIIIYIYIYIWAHLVLQISFRMIKPQGSIAMTCRWTIYNLSNL